MRRQPFDRSHLFTFYTITITITDLTQSSPNMTSTAAQILKNASSKVLRLGMMPADGIGREVLPCAQRVLQNTPGAPKFEFVHLDAGFEHFQKTGSALPEETVKALKNDCHGAMFGSVSSPSHKVEGYSSPIVKLRKELDLYANIRPVVGVRGTKDDDKFIDSVIIRENTECLVSCLCLLVPVLSSKLSSC